MYIWSIKYKPKQKLITQFVYNLQDKSSEPSYSMIRQQLSNTNESATVPKNFSPQQFPNFFKILRYIKFYGTCMKH